MKDLEHTLFQYTSALGEAKKLRTSKLRENIINDIKQYFKTTRKILDEIEQEKIEDVNYIFKTLKFEKLDDLQEFIDLESTGEKALKTVKKRFQNLALANVYNYRVSYNGIIDHLESMTSFLNMTTKLYHSR